MPVIEHVKERIHTAVGDKKRGEDLIKSPSLGSTAAIGAIFGSMNLSPNFDADEKFDEVIKLIKAVHRSKVSE